jgi:hypothetical protein
MEWLNKPSGLSHVPQTYENCATIINKFPSAVRKSSTNIKDDLITIYSILRWSNTCDFNAQSLSAEVLMASACCGWLWNDGDIAGDQTQASIICKAYIIIGGKTSMSSIPKSIATIEILKYAIVNDPLEFPHYKIYNAMESDIDTDLFVLQHSMTGITAIKHPTPEMLLYGIMKHNDIIDWVAKSLSPDMCWIIHKYSLLKFEHYKNLSPDVRKEALSGDGMLLRYLNSLDNAVVYQMIAVRENWLAIKYVWPLNEKVYELATSLNGFALGYIDVRNITFQMCVNAVCKTPLAIKYVPDDERKWRKKLYHLVAHNPIARKQCTVIDTLPYIYYQWKKDKRREFIPISDMTRTDVSICIHKKKS